ncbi:MAG: DNA methyltransferase [Chloroflexi bacterium]|nr:DNA methyltransferase [Chloroflexota bacterium]MCY3582920.1 DNA methyltransferase [Chloroflexota bacterium]MCY3715646.1 DNA methyltransferase [Chloroflexota bacterium]MDE2650616.1 DNA methyltransferase [Chloroflexota bacterium]MXX49876.1 hypothetical protein [Chloroflexota bacterium]
MSANFENRTLYHGDNLKFLRGMNSETIDLIATDPPFNKNRDFHATPDSLAAGAKFQDRWSWERDVHQDWVDQITDDYPRLMEAIESARYAHSDGMGAFMCFMAVRLLEMWRLLKPTGSLYLHCDPTASHYLKAVLDAIFGWKNFRNQITWQRSNSHNTAKRYGNVSDIILYYTRSRSFVWNRQYQPYGEAQLSRFRHTDEKGRRYKLENLTGSRIASNSGKFEWRGTMPPPSRGWGYSREQLEEWWSEGRIQTKRDGTPRMDGLKVYLDESPGKLLHNIWTDIPRIANTSSERTGFPSQKPLALYRRIIAASSNEGDIVLDPFCGCATTPVAAEQLKRQWIGMDIWDGAEEQVKTRLRKEWLFTPEAKQIVMFPHIVHIMTEPPERSDDAQPAAPFLRVKQVHEPPGPKMSRAEMYAHLLEQHGARCQGCYREFDDPRYLQLDHNVPRSDGGLNHISNRILLCGPCNRLKSNIYTLSGLRRQNKKLGYMRQ